MCRCPSSTALWPPGSSATGKNDLGPHVPIIALTARAMDEDQGVCTAAGMDAFLPEPNPRQPVSGAAELARVSERTLPPPAKLCRPRRVRCRLASMPLAALPCSSLSQFSVTGFVHLVRRLLSTRYNVQRIRTKLNFTGSAALVHNVVRTIHWNDAPPSRGNLTYALN